MSCAYSAPIVRSSCPSSTAATRWAWHRSRAQLAGARRDDAGRTSRPTRPRVHQPYGADAMNQDGAGRARARVRAGHRGDGRSGRGHHQVISPLEASWQGQRSRTTADRPAKVPELIAATTGNDDLRKRVRGTGTVSTARSAPCLDAFRVDYQTRWPNSPSDPLRYRSGLRCAYAIAYALAATRDMPSRREHRRGAQEAKHGGQRIECSSTKIWPRFSSSRWQVHRGHRHLSLRSSGTRAARRGRACRGVVHRSGTPSATFASRISRWTSRR